MKILCVENRLHHFDIEKLNILTGNDTAKLADVACLSSVDQVEAYPDVLGLNTTWIALELGPEGVAHVRANIHAKTSFKMLFHT